jgi:predicted kinase
MPLEATYEAVFAEHVLMLNHLEVPHSPKVITFSATPGMGKTVIAKKLETALQAIRLSSDDARKLLRKHNETDLSAYLGYVVQELNKRSPNHLIILDMSIDREYNNLETIAAKEGYKLFIIRLNVPRQIAEERIKSREPNPEAYLKHMDKWYQDYLAFPQSKANFILDNSQEEPSLGPLLDALSR